MSELELDVHGLRIRAGGDWPEVLGSLALDFAWFERPPRRHRGDDAADRAPARPTGTLTPPHGRPS